MKQYSLLIVDDEQIAVWGISRTINWAEIGIKEVYEAYDVEEALDCILEKHIDIVISDIEMPGRNGIDLLKWIKVNSPETKTIFLSAHAEFTYARQAMSLGGINYLLKPVEHSILKDEVSALLQIMKTRDESAELRQHKESQLKTLEQNLPEMIESFWHSILNKPHASITERQRTFFSLYKVPVTPQSQVTPVLVSIGELNRFDDDSEFIAKQICEFIDTLFLAEYKGTHLIFNDDILLISYNEFSEESEELLSRISMRCEEMLQTSVSFYLGNIVHPEELLKEYERLSWVSRQNFDDQRKRVYPSDFQPSAFESVQSPPIVSNWLPILLNGNEKEFMLLLNNMFSDIQRITPVDCSSLEEMFAGLNYIFIAAARKNGILGNFFSSGNNSKKFVKSVDSLQQWALHSTEAYFKELAQIEKNTSKIVKKVEEYVFSHISEDFHREDIAHALYFNPSYLSRIFKGEKGVSLTEYIAHLRLQHAKKIFDTTDMNISMVAKKTGFYNFSYFSKQFKDTFGLTPSEYKKARQYELS